MRLCLLVFALLLSSRTFAGSTLELPLQGFQGLRIGMDATAAVRAYRLKYPNMARVDMGSALEVFGDKASKTKIFLCKQELVALQRDEYGSVNLFGDKATEFITNGATTILDLTTRNAKGVTNVYVMRLAVPGDSSGTAMVSAIGPSGDEDGYLVTSALSKFHTCA